jgi:phosphatidate cytidylyltransferase
MKGLVRRGLTALIFVLIILGGLYGGRYSFVILFAVVTGLCLWEFFSITLHNNAKQDRVRKIIGLIFGLTPFLLASMLKLDMMDSPEKFILLSSILCFPFLFLSFVFELFAKSEKPFTNVAFIILGMVYIGIPFALLDFIAFDGKVFYTNTVLGLLILTWSNDTAAYVVGSQIGKTKLFPSISPKKTWEGSIGGVVITILIAILVSFFFEECTMVQWIVLAIIVVIFGSIGDLVESMLKRSYSIKDSGTLLPGHGGFLDRFDAFIFLIPFATAYLLWIRS